MLQARRGLTGIMNYTNPSAISHNEILELYKSYIDPEFTWKNFSLEEQSKVIIAPRSNNLLDTARVSPAPSMYPPSRSTLCCTEAVVAVWIAAAHLVNQCSAALKLCLAVEASAPWQEGRSLWGLCAVASAMPERVCCALQIEGEFPEILGIRESLIKHVFEPAALQVRLFCHFPVQHMCSASLASLPAPPLGQQKTQDRFHKGLEIDCKSRNLAAKCAQAFWHD